MKAVGAGLGVKGDLTIGQINHDRERGSVILNAWLRDRRQTQAATTMKQVRRHKNYAGAKISRMNTGWSTGPVPADWHIWNGLRALRSRSREQYRNNDYARRFVRMCQSNIVGPNGMPLQSKISDLNGQPDRLARDAVERAWRDWSRECDVAQRLNLTQMLEQIIATVAVDGEILVRRITRGAFHYQLQLIDPELLDLNLNADLGNGHRIRMGVEMDAFDAPVAYHLIDAAQADIHRGGYYTGKHIRVPANEIRHLYRHEAVGQTRGVPWMASALVRMKNLYGYEEAAVIAARIGASKMGFFKATDGEGAEPLVDDETADGEFIQDAEPGAFEVLPEGYDFTAFNPDYPHQQFPDFVKATLRGISSGLGVAYNGLANDLEGVNYSSIRAGVIEEREQWKSLQNWLVDAFLRPVFESWLHEQLAYGNIRVPSKTGQMVPLPASKFDRFRQASFQPRRWAWVDPLKDIEAARVSIELGLKSRSEVIREMGRDPDDVWDEIKTERDQLDGLGLPDLAQPASDVAAQGANS